MAITYPRGRTGDERSTPWFVAEPVPPLPVVLTRDDVQAVLANLSGDKRQRITTERYPDNKQIRTPYTGPPNSR